MNLIKYSFLLLALLIGCAPSEPSGDLELIGHRGATGLMPENSIPAFKAALDEGVGGLELDVVISADDSVVVSHEPWFRHDICRTPEGDSISADSQKENLIYQMNYEQVAQYDCGSVQRPGYPEQQNQPTHKPLLKEVVREMETYIEENGLDPVTYNVEIKSKPAWDGEIQPAPEETVRLVNEALTELDITDRARIFAFDPRVLNHFEQENESLPRVYLISGNNTNMKSNLEKVNTLPAVYAPSHSIVDSALVEQVHERGMQVFAWTVNDVERMQQLVDLGVNGIISDYPNYFSQLKR